jgi:hypothetical protein
VRLHLRALENNSRSAWQPGGGTGVAVENLRVNSWRKQVANLSRIVVGSVAIVLAATNATAQSRGSTIEALVTVQDRDLNGAQRASEMVLTRTTQNKDSEEVVVETYSPSMYAGRLALSERVRRVTTVTSDGSRRTIEEIEEPPHGSPHETMRVVRRSITTVRRSGPDSYVTEQQVFARDVNGRFVPVQTQIERTSRR